MLRIDSYALAAVDLNQPGELHDRPASGIENLPLDLVGAALDPKHTSTNNGYLCGSHVLGLVSATTSGSRQDASPSGSRREAEAESGCTLTLRAFGPQYPNLERVSRRWCYRCYARATNAAPRFSRRRSESRFDADRAGEGRKAMRSSACDLLRGAELKAQPSPSTTSAGSRLGLNRSRRTDRATR
jgi:hypothetical protein